MDIFRTLLCAGLAMLFWNFRFRGIRPIRDFVLWGVSYPFHFTLMSLLILVIWGLIGVDFGLQGLFLENNALTQLLLGATVMLLFAALILHYSVLDSPGRWWNNSLRTLIGVMRDLNALMPADYSVQRILPNGFLEKLDRREIDVLYQRIHHGSAPLPIEPMTEKQRGDLSDMLRDEPFRLLVSPAILLIKGLMLVVLVGVVPTVLIPLLNRDVTKFVERLPWLVGVLLGDLLGIALACLTTRWAAQAAGWERFEQRLLGAIRALTEERRLPDPSAALSAPGSEPARSATRGAAVASQQLPSPEAQSNESSPRWMSLLFMFFAIHFLVNVVLPEGITAWWANWPEQTYIKIPDDAGVLHASTNRWTGIPWLPMAVLAAEAIGAYVLLALPRIVPHGRLNAAVRVCVAYVSRQSKVVTRLALEILSNRRARWIAFASLLALAAVVVAIATASSASLARSLEKGLSGLAFLGTFLGFWLFAFRIATRDASLAREGDRRAELPILSGASLFVLVLLYLAGILGWVVLFLAMAAFFGSLYMALGNGQLTRSLYVVLVVASLGGMLFVGLAKGEIDRWVPLWVGLSVLVLGATALIRVARARPALLYPLTLLLAFASFAIPYNTLDERWQGAMPAAGSIACMVGLLAAVYTMIAFLRPKGTLMVAAAVAAAVVVLNGNAWFVEPNEFKATFPNMEAYYALPVYLNSRDYFRDTTPSAVQLRDRALTSDVDRMARQGASERLATAYFRMEGQRAKPGGGHALRLSVEDPRGRLRAGVGDEMRLASEEWFTSQLEGDDCIVLAEEPFFRKIYRWFRYERLQFIRDGIIRGTPYLLHPATGLPHTLSAGLTSATRSAPYEPVAGPGERLGLRLAGLARAYRDNDAQYVLISMYWSGHVTAVKHESHLDTYEVEFDIPHGYQALDPSQLSIMAAWLERCHLDAMRPAENVRPNLAQTTAKPLLPEVPGALPGDCLVLEDARAESPVAAGVYLFGAREGGKHYPNFEPYWPTEKNLSAIMEGTPAPVIPVQSEGPEPKGAAFTMRPAHDRGIFASPDRVVATTVADPSGVGPKPVRIALYNARRLRPGDRLVFSWNGQGHKLEPGEVRRSRIFVIQDAAAADTSGSGTEVLPAGYRWADVIPVAGSGVPIERDRSNGASDSRGPLVGEWQLLQPLNNTEVLLAWRQLVGGLWKERKPKLVIVTVSGGGIRASLWTSVVLRKLERTLGAEFPYHVRLITGASGGMVGGSYYATSLRPPPPHVLRGGQADFQTLHGVSSVKFVDAMANDQLDAVAGRLVFADLISPLNPYLQKGDRGRTLEKTWARWTGGEEASPLAHPLQSYAADERLGWRPSMVYTPMMVEDGRRLLVSNLDLAFATRNVGGLLIEASSRKIDRPAFQGEDLDRSIHDEDDVFSLSAVEFFRLFPEAHRFQVATAVRMSASFPWVSPAISLPTLPPRRVVDAGYYDNYGVNLAALWLTKMRSWLEANTSGVVVIQIRDHVSQGARTEIDFDRLSGSSPLDRLTWHADRELITPGIQAISTPLLGISNARQWTMSFRNDEQVDLLDLLFDDEKSRDFFRTVVFECPVEVSLNWQLSLREKDILASGFGRAEADPRDELTRTKDYLIGRDSYEFHKWKVEHRNNPTFQADLKTKYAEQLRILGIQGTERLSLAQSQQLYENIVMNLKRLELLRDWWRAGHEKRLQAVSARE